MHEISTAQAILIVVLVFWDLFWKGWALWRSAKRGQSIWFIAILIINSAGILPIIYLLKSSMHNDNQAKS